MKAVWSRFWGFPVNAGKDSRGLQKYNISGDVTGTCEDLAPNLLPADAKLSAIS